MARKPWEPPDAHEVRKRWRDCSDELLDARRNFQLNRAFFTGQQHVSWNSATESTEIELSQPRNRSSRMIVNHYRSRANSLYARLFPSPLAFEVEPSDVSPSAARRQRLQETILEGCRTSLDWEQVRMTAGRFKMLGATVAVALEWDPNARGLKVIDPLTGKPRHVGGVRLTPLSIAEFGVEPGTRDVADALWWVRATTLTPAQAQARYNLEEPPQPDAQSMYLPHQRYLLGRRTQNAGSRMCMVYVYYERPRPEQGVPGCVVHVVAEHRFVYEWPFPWNDLNVGLARMNELGDTWMGDTPLSDARQVQVAYNDARTAMRAHVQRAANARIMYPAGSIGDEDDWTDDVAEMVEYQPDGMGGKPEWFHAPEVPRWLAMEPQNLLSELDEVFHTHAVTRGQAPGDRNSGLALSILAEKDDGPLGPTARDEQRMWERLARLTLQTYRHHVGDAKAQTMVERDSGPVLVEWTQDDIDEEPKVRVPLESVMPRSQAATRSELVSIAQAFPSVQAAMDVDTTARVLGMGDLHAAFRALDPDAQKADRENEAMLSGQPAVPDDWDEHAKHILRHNAFRSSPDYEAMPEQARALVDAHVEAHERLMMDAQMEEAMRAMAMMPPPPGTPELGPPPGAPGEPPIEEMPAL